ncbi:MAG TPA: 3-phosphoserine/phosphohydroxythreonine transaminase [Steroidobacteraceae bacterium]|nr:3-phosphoserine/phosphohydroxythreonine transaminase [Steroidobacteraceae bacterium]
MRPYNFSAGPAMLPVEVLEQVREELIDWNRSGASVMEVSHRGAEFMRLAAQAEQDVRELLGVGADYEVLFMQGGASAQFALVPLNLTAPGSRVDYIDSGYWSKKAIAEARRYLDVRIAAATDGTRVPAQDEIDLDRRASYVHYTPNETIGGVEFPYVPATGSVPLVADFSSSILSRPLDVSRFALIYAGAQKNLGPAGLTLVIVKKALLGRARPETPSVFDYRRIAEERSLLNTPPTFAWYVAARVLQWLKKHGGLEAMAQRNEAKAGALYAALDASALFKSHVAPASRSCMNVVFSTGSAEIDAAFIEAAAAQGLMHLKGHRAVGGMRASLYNAMPLEGVHALVEFMREFERVRA